MKIIAVDFDGTIAKTRYPVIVELMPESRYITKWRKMGHKVVMWTCRVGEPLEQAVAFCRQNGIAFDGVNVNVGTKYHDDPRKISADIYIDDKCPMPVDEQWEAVDRMLQPTRRANTQITERTPSIKLRGRR